MSVSYQFKRPASEKSATSLANVGRDLAALLSHMDTWQIELESLIIKGDYLEMSLSDEIPKDQLEHLGMDEVV